jgi:hypothetical protein
MSTIHYTVAAVQGFSLFVGGEAYELSLPVKHTTAAQNLVTWPSIKTLIPKGITTSYVMDEESARSLLRLHGCGEGSDKNDGHEGAPSSPASSSPSERRRSDDEASSSPHGVWGSGQLFAPITSAQPHPVRDHAGGVSANGGLMLDADAVDRYFRSFMDNIHILHPFLEPKVLRTMVHSFKKKYSCDFRAFQPLVSGSRRKLETKDTPNSVEENGVNRNHARTHGLDVLRIEHSAANAIVLLVLALGKVIVSRYLGLRRQLVCELQHHLT